MCNTQPSSCVEAKAQHPTSPSRAKDFDFEIFDFGRGDSVEPKSHLVLFELSSRRSRSDNPGSMVHWFGLLKRCISG